MIHVFTSSLHHMLLFLIRLLPWLLLLALLLLIRAFPVIRRARRRRRLIRRLEQARGSRVIAMIHRGGGLRMLTGGGSIGLAEAEAILKVLRELPADKPIDLLLHTPGGMVLSTAQIARALKRHPAPVRVIVPHWAMSGGTFLALVADEIVMDKNAVLGPVDPQVVRFPGGMTALASVLRAVREKSKDEIDDETWALADQAEKAIRQLEDHIADLLEGRFAPQRARELARTFTEGRWTHDYPIAPEELQTMGLNVSTDVPKEAYELLEAFPSGARFRSVQWLPGKKRREDASEPEKPAPGASS